ncbi:pyridoxal phosphate-dependent aminotransferase [Thermaurantiacus tibetensis]|uniref:pyridoxal phosphate-dependent aminotransferase n=1 Tax=Thermaurantiacus tibetensis TaxID=2759035 RepID=UPI00188E70D9|nr:histidinol-phosphate transaminase [Thermaurantiacus tibetensis]
MTERAGVSRPEWSRPGVSRRGVFAGAAGLVALAGAPGAGRAAPAPAPALFGPPPGVAQLSRNENPYGPSPAALRAIAETAALGCWYANAATERLAAMIAERNGLAPDHVMVGAGSSEVLDCATMAFGRSGAIVAPELLFDPPLAYAEGKGVEVRRVPLAPDMGIDLDALAAAARAPGVALVHLCNPNNPTGLAIPGATLAAFIDRLPGHVTVLVDEAYNELTPDPPAFSVVGRVRAGDRVIVTRTFSKLHGLAGLRVGYALGRPDLLERLRPWSMSVGGNTAGLAAAVASLDDAPFLAMSRARIVEGREMIAAAAAAQGLPTLPSAANFVLVRVPDAERLRAALAAEKILVRGPYGRFREWSRVSCGRLEDIRRYAEALPRALAA